MNYWIYCEPVGETSHAVWMIYSEDAIIAEYWDYWEGRMNAFNNAHGRPKYENISVNNCICDWVSTHWAVPATPEHLQKITQVPRGS